MKGLLVIMFLMATSLYAMASPQDIRPALSQDELVDMLTSKTPSKVIISLIDESGIAFQPTPQLLEHFRKLGADRVVLAALRGAWHESIPQPLGDKELLVMVAGGTPSGTVIKAVQERGIDFQPAYDYLTELRADGGTDPLIDLLQHTMPRPFSKEELLRQLRTHADQQRLARTVRERGIDFESSPQTLQALRGAGAGPLLLEALRTTQRAKPFAPQTPASVAPPPMSAPLEGHRPATLICGSSDHDVPVFDDSGNLGKIVARLRCGEKVTFVERVAAPPGFDRIQFADGQEGVVSNYYLESAIATPGGDVTPPQVVSQPSADYTAQARNVGLEGTVKFWIVIDAQGNVTDVKESSAALGDGLDESAIATVKKWRFSPAMRNGSPVPVRVQVEVTFHIHRGPKAR